MEEVENILAAKNIKVELEKFVSCALCGMRRSAVVNGGPTLCNCYCESHCSLSLHVSWVKQDNMEIMQDGWGYCLDTDTLNVNLGWVQG